MKNRKFIMRASIFVLLPPIIINILISLIPWGSGSNDGWLGFWGGYLGAVISIFGIYYQVAKSIEESEKNREETKKSNESSIRLLQEQADRDREKITSQQEQLTEQKAKEKEHMLQSVRPFIRVTFPKKPNKELTICFKGEINNIWLKYGDFYSTFDPDINSREKLEQTQLGSLCTSPLIITQTREVDKEYPFILKIKTMHNEEVFIYHTPGNPDVYCYEKDVNNKKLMDSDGYIGIKDNFAENKKIFTDSLKITSWSDAVNKLDKKYRETY